MKISTKGRYALRLMLDLAIHAKGTAVPCGTWRSAGDLRQVLRANCHPIGPGRTGAQRPGRGWRLSADPGARGLHRGRDSAAAGGQPRPR